MWGSSRDEDGIADCLCNGPALYSVLLQQPLAEVRVQVDELVMDGVCSCTLLHTPLLTHLGMGESEYGGMRAQHQLKAHTFLRKDLILSESEAA